MIEDVSDEFIETKQNDQTYKVLQWPHHEHAF